MRLPPPTIAVGQPRGLARLSPAARVMFDPATKALIARMTTPPTSARVQAIDACIRALKAAAVWSKLDGLYLLAAADSQAARLNWIADQYNLTAVSAPTFTADRGFTGDGSASYLNTNFNPATAAGQFAQNSAHLGVWRRSLPTTASLRVDIGQAGAFPFPGSMVRQSSTTFDEGAVNNNITTTGTLAPTTGHLLATRSSSSAFTLYRNNTAGTAVSATSTSLSSFSMYIGALNLNGTAAQFSDAQQSAAHFGAGLTAQNVTDLYNALHTYLQAVGAVA